MFTQEQIESAHSNVKSGADFPAYIKEITSLGVTHYQTYVTDGHIDYHGANNYSIHLPAKYEPKHISDHVHQDEFKKQLVEHQQGKTDFLTFIHMCAETGIEKWEISIEDRTCSYFDKSGNKVLVEEIPQ